MKEYNKIFDILNDVANKNGEKIALADDNGTITFDRLIEEINLVSQNLLTMGINDKTTVAICGFVSIRYIIVYLSVISIGAKFTVLNPYIDIDMLSQLITFSDADYVFFENSLKYKCDEEGRSSFAKSTKISTDHIFFINELFNKNMDVNTDDLVRYRKNNIKGAMCMVYTSGTESFPKLALISEKAIVKSLYSLNDAVYMPEGAEASLIALPFNHLYAMNVFFYTLLMPVKKVVFTYNLSPDNLLRVVSKNNVQVVFSIAALFNGMAASNENDNAKKQLLACVNSGCPVSDNEYALYGRMFPNATFYHVYGLTEATGPVSVLHAVDVKNLSCNNGKVIDGIDVKIASNGEILLKGDVLKESYYKLPLDKQGVDNDGYFHTGDIGRFDDDNNLYVMGRLKDIIIKGGENISSTEIEKVLLMNKDIKEAAVIGKPSEKYGEDIYAYITVSDGYTFDEEMIKKEIAKSLGNFKVPVKITVIDKMPVSGLGKIEKKKLEAL